MMNIQDTLFDFGFIQIKRGRWGSRGYLAFAIKMSIVAGANVFCKLVLPVHPATQVRAHIREGFHISLVSAYNISAITVGRFLPTVDRAAGIAEQGRRSDGIVFYGTGRNPGLLTLHFCRWREQVANSR